jgi:hypothetical protein
MKSGIRKAIWRSRAVAIIGFLTMLLAIFHGLPAELRSTLFVVFGLLVMSFGLAGSRHKSYADLPRPKVVETVASFELREEKAEPEILVVTSEPASGSDVLFEQEKITVE